MTALITLLTMMKAHWRWWLSIIAMVVIAWLWNENTRAASSLATMQDDANSSRTITSNVLRTVAITNIILETNQHAKQQIALESQRASSDIKAAVASDDCAARLVPVVAANRLRQYADSLRSGTASTSISQSDH